MMPMARPDEPAYLREHGPSWTERWLARRAQDPSAAFEWPQLGGQKLNKLLLNELLSLTHNHCSYCDHSPLGAGSRQTIDHFRPKSSPSFRHLAFMWTNLFACCDVCQARKAEGWDELLLKPDETGYSFDRFFEFNPFDGSLHPQPFASKDQQARSEATIRLLGLNDAPRREARRAALRRYLHARRASIPIDSGESYRFLHADA